MHFLARLHWFLNYKPNRIIPSSRWLITRQLFDILKRIEPNRLYTHANILLRERESGQMQFIQEIRERTIKF